MKRDLGLYQGAKRPKCNPDFTSEIGANESHPIFIKSPVLVNFGTSFGGRGRGGYFHEN